MVDPVLSRQVLLSQTLVPGDGIIKTAAINVKNEWPLKRSDRASPIYIRGDISR